MGNTVTVGERPATDMASEDAVHLLYKTIAMQFDTPEEKLDSTTRFAELGADEHSMEELRTNFEDALHASRGGKTPELIIADFNSADTIGDLLTIIRNSQIL